MQGTEPSATPRDARPCSCGTYSIGRCASCGQDVCGMHSSIRGPARLCDPCQEKAARRAREQAEFTRVRAAQERESWPPAGHDDRVRSVSTFPPPEQKVRPVRVSGAELAACLLEGGVAPRTWTTVRRRLLWKGTAVRKRIHGWALPGPGAAGKLVSTAILATNGTQWRYRDNTLVRVRPKKEMYDGAVLGQLYRRSDTYAQRRSAADPPA